MKSAHLDAQKINDWVASVMETGSRVIAPVEVGEETLFTTIESPEQAKLDDGLTTKSAKGVFFPQSEVILNYEQSGSDVKVQGVENMAPETVLLGVRPCDAAALDILDSVFSWDYKDKFYLDRREKTTVVTMACLEPLDESCFCSSVGLSPNAKQGDVLMVKESDGGYYIQALTDKGEALLERTSGTVQEVETKEIPKSEPKPKFDLEKIKPWLDKHFEDDIWKEMSLKCVGCGTCTFLCPTCHCFDIVDETRLGKGVRRKNWDSCQFSLFTRHASGHNPRNIQAERYRQRIMHKFKYYFDKFGRTLCVGCGRCVRSCPVGHSLLDYLETISNK